MRLTRRLAAVASTLAVAPFILFTADAHAQAPIRVVRHSPPDSIRAGDAITISFDRPVTSSLERGAVARRPLPLASRWE